MIYTQKSQELSFNYIIFVFNELEHSFHMDAKEFLPAGGSYHNGEFVETITFPRENNNKMDCQ